MGLLLLICFLVIIFLAYGDENSTQDQIETVQVQCPHCKHIFLHKINSKSTRKFSRAGAITGSILGSVNGSKIGIAGGFGGVNGAIPAAIVFAAVGALIGHLVADQSKGYFQCPNCKSMLKLKL